MPRTAKSQNPVPEAVTAEPTKRFFVRMLVRDIELVPAIVDLVDNSVDGARHALAKRDGTVQGKNGDKPPPLEDFKVKIELDETQFSIEDNCGGISIEDATKYAFRFGRPDDVDPIEGEVGQFGVGMKRALFKIGEWFSVASTTSTSQFTVDVNVPRWLDQKGKWRFPIAVAGGRAARRPIGTRILVKSLFPSVATRIRPRAVCSET